MKKIVLMIAFVVGTTAFAQERKMDKKEHFSTEAKVEKMTKELDLTAEQQKKLTVLFDKQKTEMQKQKAAAKLERSEKREALSSKKEEMDKEIRSILTPEDRKSTRLNSSHVKISYAVFCLKNKRQRLLHV